MNIKAKKRILIVDDEGMIRETFKRILTTSLPDCQVAAVADGADAMEAFSLHQYHVLILDLKMPVMDGPNALYEIDLICENRNWPLPVVIFCTGYVPPETVRELVKSSPRHRLLIKPVSRDVLLQTVKECLEVVA